MKLLFCGIYAAALLVGGMPALAADQSAQQIRQVINQTYDQPGALVSIPIIVKEGDYALADWQQAHKGGRALLQRQAQTWQILACGGAGFKQAQALQAMGLPSALASKLSRALSQAEQNLTDKQRELYDSFDANLTHAQH